TGTHIGELKIPGGYVDEGEHIATAVVREVFEETGIRAEFEGVVGVRHMHRTLYGKSNVSFVCRLKAVSAEITIDPVEIATARWMMPDDFLAHPQAQAFHKGIVRMAQGNAGFGVDAWPPYDPDLKRVELFSRKTE
ncbi:MAG: NUDIX domain-containing protein, partial [Methylococcales bacterium]|nr:NUDIX domain-containing protein [Methylococcales bacterium]